MNASCPVHNGGAWSCVLPPRCTCQPYRCPRCGCCRCEGAYYRPSTATWTAKEADLSAQYYRTLRVSGFA